MKIFVAFESTDVQPLVKFLDKLIITASFDWQLYVGKRYGSVVLVVVLPVVLVVIGYVLWL